MKHDIKATLSLVVTCAEGRGAKIHLSLLLDPLILPTIIFKDVTCLIAVTNTTKINGSILVTGLTGESMNSCIKATTKK